MNKNTRNTLIVGAVVGAGALIYYLTQKKEKEKEKSGGAGAGAGAGTQDTTPSGATYGCTDPDAENYDASANNSNNSCEYAEGCTQSSALNYDSEAFLDDGSCEFEGTDPSASPVYGCTDSLAQNFNPSATVGDDSCQYLEGCKNPSATNYNPSAIIDDGSCLFGEGSAQQDAEYVFGCADPKADSYYDDVDINVIENSGQVFIADNQQCTYETTGGCTSPSADNFDPNAKYDDGSCQFNDLSVAVEQGTADGNYLIGCTDSSADNFLSPADLTEGQQLVSDNAQCTYDTTGGCTSPVADNYDSTALFDNGTCTFNNLPQDVEVASSSDFYLVGCTNTLADNYITEADLTGNQVLAPDASQCTFVTNSGCTVENALNYDVSAVFDDGSCEFDETSVAPTSISYFPVCNDPEASNFANAEIGSELAPNFIYAADNSQCIYSSGCTDSNAINYDPDAYNDDSSCLFNGGVSGNTMVSPGEAERIFLNCFGGDTGTAALIDFLAGYGSEIPLGDVQDLTRDLDGENCFLTTEDVLPAVDVNYEQFCADPNATNTGDSIAIEQAGNYPVPNNSLCDYTGVEGCTDPNADNTSPTATIDDGTCIYDFVTENVDTGLPYDELYVEVCNDPNADNTDDTQPIIEGGQIPVPNNSLCTYNNAYGCTDPNAVGDANGEGAYNPEATIDNGTCKYGYSEAVADGAEFGDLYVTGCTDPQASNQLDTAEIIANNQIVITNNSLCEYIEGCTDPAANGNAEGEGAYNPAATLDDGSCQYDYSTEIDTSLPADQLYVFGCTDPRADNYLDSEVYAEGGQIVISDNTECEYTYGCTDPNALPTSYNPDAGLDNGSCQYPEPEIIYGCTDPLANNTDEDAMVDDGTCEYDLPEEEVDPLTAEDLYVFGCTDALADEQINSQEILDAGQIPVTDNSQCEYSFGCTDPLATGNENGEGAFDENAVIDDGSCQYSLSEEIAEGVNIEDLYVFGCTDQLATIESQIDTQQLLDDGFVPVTDNDQCVYIFGCTDPNATGDANGEGVFNPEAVLDDGSCRYSSTLSQDVQDAVDYLDVYVFACTDPSADEFLSPSDLEDGQILVSDNDQCEFTYGCTDPNATGDATGQGAFNEAAGIDDGSCLYGDLSEAEAQGATYEFACTDPAANNQVVPSDLPEGVFLISDNAECTYTLGCTNDQATNYNPLAGQDDGGCTFDFDESEVDLGGDYAFLCTDPAVADQSEIEFAESQGQIVITDNSLCNYSQLTQGCTDSNAINYNPSSQQDDGSCMFSGSIFPDTEITLAEASLINGNCNAQWTGAATLIVLNYPGEMTLGALQDTILEELPDAVPCYEFIDDTQVDDFNYVPYCPIAGYSNYYSQEIADAILGDEFTIAFPDPSVCSGGNAGCITEGALNFNVIVATSGGVDDGSCVFAGMGPDYFVDEATSIDIVEFSCPEFNQNWSNYLDISDLTQFTLQQINDLTELFGGTCFEFPVYEEEGYTAGCTIPYADNYDEDADIDDGSCTFVSVSGCTDPEASNYGGETILFDDGSCKYDEPTYGCTDPSATNYDPEADFDAGNCVYEEEEDDTGTDGGTQTGDDGTQTGDDGDAGQGELPIWGCTFENDPYYDPTATVDDGTCRFSGCGDPQACNYNAGVKQQGMDNSVCLYAPDPLCPPN